mmetsp:Transcript_129018/g.373312  ORF Transcript_129018/g.373312 Transcript_129018/m.373312 type:complete len:447 (+) Transcript_129018:72-1412(+)
MRGESTPALLRSKGAHHEGVWGIEKELFKRIEDRIVLSERRVAEQHAKLENSTKALREALSSRFQALERWIQKQKADKNDIISTVKSLLAEQIQQQAGCVEVVERRMATLEPELARFPAFEAKLEALEADQSMQARTTRKLHEVSEALSHKHFQIEEMVQRAEALGGSIRGEVRDVKQEVHRHTDDIGTMQRRQQQWEQGLSDSEEKVLRALATTQRDLSLQVMAMQAESDEAQVRIKALLQHVDEMVAETEEKVSQQVREMRTELASLRPTQVSTALESLVVLEQDVKEIRTRLTKSEAMSESMRRLVQESLLQSRASLQSTATERRASSREALAERLATILVRVEALENNVMEAKVAAGFSPGAAADSFGCSPIDVPHGDMAHLGARDAMVDSVQAQLAEISAAKDVALSDACDLQIKLRALDEDFGRMASGVDGRGFTRTSRG